MDGRVSGLGPSGVTGVIDLRRGPKGTPEGPFEPRHDRLP